jgi:NADPH-dependent 2,4-dienoyl-CoA reductase/sulfur reductase-like enzyme
MTRHVIVGQGVAGISAAEEIRAVDRSAEIIIVSNDPNGFYSRPGLAITCLANSPKNKCMSIPRKIGAA